MWFEFPSELSQDFLSLHYQSWSQWLTSIKVRQASLEECLVTKSITEVISILIIKTQLKLIDTSPNILESGDLTNFLKEAIPLHVWLSVATRGGSGPCPSGKYCVFICMWHAAGRGDYSNWTFSLWEINCAEGNHVTGFPGLCQNLYTPWGS